MIAHIVPARASEAEFIEKKSRFIGRVFPVEAEQDALTELARLRKQYYNASHNCYCYAVGERGEIARYSDDGEPAGTAGLPMMDVLKKRGVTNALVVVTRYFGGVLLGASGLVRAYTRAAADALSLAGEKHVIPAAEVAFSCPYPQWGWVQAVIAERRWQAEVSYRDAVDVVLVVEAGMVREVCDLIVDRSNGRIDPVVRGDAVLCRET